MHETLATARTCPHCNHDLVEADATFCSKCGRSLSLSRVSRSEHKIAITLLILLLLGCVLGVYYLYIRPASLLRDAERKIEAAISACHTGNGTEFARRMVDAEMAIDEVGFPRSTELSIALDNRLRLVGCK